jgi:hypothetical protein
MSGQGRLPAVATQTDEAQGYVHESDREVAQRTGT